MSTKRRVMVLIAVAASLGIAAGVVLMASSPTKKPPPSPGGFYYTGPMRNKSGTGYGTEDGRAVPAPEGAPATRQKRARNSPRVPGAANR